MFSKIKFSGIFAKLTKKFRWKGRKTRAEALVKYEPIKYIPARLPPRMPPKVQFAELLKRVEATMAGRGIKIDYSYTKETKYFLGIKTSEMYLKGSAPYIDVMLHPRKGRKLLRTALKGAPEEVIKRYLDDLEKIIKKFKKDAGKNFENIKRNYFRK